MEDKLADTIAVWNTVGVWFTGVATFSASIVALYLARRSSKIDLKVKALIRPVLDAVGGVTDKRVIIEVTNLADRSVPITDIGWIAKTRKKCVYGSQVPAEKESDAPPFVLAFGETKTLMVSLGVAPYWPGFIANQFLSSFEPSEFKVLRAVVTTSVGQTAYAKPSQGIIDMLLEARKVPVVPPVLHINQSPSEDGSFFGM